MHCKCESAYYYVLASENPQPVVIIKSPTKTKDQKQFLGYDWSGTKGSEGIKYLTSESSPKDESEDDVDQDIDNEERVVENLNSLQHIHTPLYDPQRLYNPDKLNSVIQQNFMKQPLTIPETLQPFLTTARLVDMLDFSRISFDKHFSLTPTNSASLDTIYNLVRLGDICNIVIGGTPSRENTGYFRGNNLWVSISEMKGDLILDTKEKITNEAVTKSNVKLIPKGTTLLSFKLSIGKVAIAGADLYTNEAIAGLIPKSDNISDEYLFQLFGTKLIDLENTGFKAFGKSLNSAFLKDDIKIPLPPTSVQAHIVAECGVVDVEAAAAKQAIKKVKQTIEELIQGEFDKGYSEKQLRTVALINPSKTEIKDVDENTLVSFVEMASVSNDGFIEHKEDRPLKDLKKGSYTYFRENDIILAKITPCMENGKSALAQGLTNGLAMGSSEFHVVRTQDAVTPKYVFTLLNREAVRNEAEPNMTGSSGHRRVPASFYENYKIPVPPLEKQAELVVAVELLEAQITAAQAVLDGAAARKQEIIQRYLSDQTLAQPQQAQSATESSVTTTDNEPVDVLNQ